MDTEVRDIPVVAANGEQLELCGTGKIVSRHVGGIVSAYTVLVARNMNTRVSAWCRLPSKTWLHLLVEMV